MEGAKERIKRKRRYEIRLQFEDSSSGRNIRGAIETMNLAILHYHLQSGGVTRVIENHLRALCVDGSSNNAFSVLLLFGGRKDGWAADFESKLSGIDLKLCPVAGLDYDLLSAADQSSLYQNIRSCLNQHGFSPAETLLHVHNHGLGKNAAFPRALCRLAKDGYRLLLQIHDFAEDFRPANYRELTKTFTPEERSTLLYPQAGQIHYAVLNRRDFQVLESAGVSRECLQFLPNPVPEIGDLPDQHAARRRLAMKRGLPLELPLYLYPVRGIRRKNVGEMLLWAAAHRDQSAFGMTLAPQNPRERPGYERWQHFATERGLPCWWELGGSGGVDFRGNLAAADAILTTSVAEGFGMVFLEAWLADRELRGRNLPHITADFVEEGVQFPALYDRLNLPTGWIGKPAYAQALAETIHPLTEAYQLPPAGPAEIEQLVESRCAQETIDFGDLNEALQAEIIRRVQAEESARAELLHINPQLNSHWTTSPNLIARNGRIIRKAYSLAGSKNRLLSIYRQLQQSPVDEVKPLAGTENILASFLNLEELRMIRS